MPRSLARLRYRLPPAPVSFDGIDASRGRLLERKVAQYVVRQSNPRHLRLQTVVNPKAKPTATGHTLVRPVRPYTLRDVVDPHAHARHGQIIYVFRSIKTNQVIYSLQELLDHHHLAQLPFIGKHSVPAQLRPDEWTPYCVLAFATPEQGHHAFRKLREFRKLHELAWEKTNPGWKQLKIEHRIKKIMDQRANTAADIAEVLRLQDTQAIAMAVARDDQQAKAATFIQSKWASIDALAAAAADKANQASSVAWLEHEIRRLSQKMKMKHLQTDAHQKALAAARTSHETRLRRVQYALRKAEQLKQINADLAAQAAPANEPGAQEKLDDLRAQAESLRESLENPDPTRSQDLLAADADALDRHTADIAALDAAFAAKLQLDARDHYIARSVLPHQLKTPLPEPFDLDSVRVMWADMQDALHAAGKWPHQIAHETLPINAARDATAYLSAEEFEVEKQNEVSRILDHLRSDPDADDEPDAVAPVPVEQKTGVLAMLGKANPFKRAQA